ncbi:FKBP-type peptidyl-prolyl cis-trans isomerase [Eggerthella guodeyinii]|uniref:Peptidyl-prolyl cis-trans isomerase n=2 Tax=Eggerthella TaxID=84111 RepID=A0A6L7IX29_9ACTN|nr:FKBP-type peptidyl-prolyl cis-trans isomerase [Eggerthella guodeyinii]MBC5585055.1 FKBP-type peptidyl-prolyl cis-trans isomerase [Eggerthella hominis]QOS67495.1 FKBP-type peptidyl-prolyl cis-trans isomerase [Eggerthella guodeyinii]
MSNENRMVKVAYRGYFDDGSTFIEQIEQPIEYPCVEGWMPPVFIETVRDMAVGETRCAHVGANEAWEEHTDERVIRVERAKIPADVKLVVGELVNLEQPDGQTFPARLVELDDELAVFDMNDEAIAKALNFEITLLDVYDLPDR